MANLDLDLPRGPLPLFPLTGTLLLPGNFLPLNVFEDRYRAMVEDAMDGERFIGMIQPFSPRDDNSPSLEVLLEEVEDHPPLYQIGCAGRIERCDPQSYGRFHLLLRGVSRFRVKGELPLHRGYRRATTDFSEFGADVQEPFSPLESTRVLAALEAFAKRHGLGFDRDVLAALSGIGLVNGLSVALPFHPAEKQALLEAAGPRVREELLLTLMDMGLDATEPSSPYPPPLLN